MIVKRLFSESKNNYKLMTWYDQILDKWVLDYKKKAENLKRHFLFGVYHPSNWIANWYIVNSCSRQ